MKTFILIEWSEIQNYMQEEGCRQNACLANDSEFLDSNCTIKSSAYFVNKEWAERVDKN